MGTFAVCLKKTIFRMKSVMGTAVMKIRFSLIHTTSNFDNLNHNKVTVSFLNVPSIRNIYCIHTVYIHSKSSSSGISSISSCHCVSFVFSIEVHIFFFKFSQLIANANERFHKLSSMAIAYFKIIVPYSMNNILFIVMLSCQI